MKISRSISLIIFFIAIFFCMQGISFSNDISDSSDRFTDDGGREIVVNRPFRKIISLYGAHTENLFFIGAGRSLIGVSKNDDYPEEAGRKPVFSYHDDPEKFLGSGPDLVLIRPMIDRAYPELVSRLEKSGITIVSLQPGSIREMYRYWEIIGCLSGRQKAAKQMIVSFKEKAAYYHGLTSGLKNRKRVYFESIHRKMKTFTPGSMAIFVLETAGGINMAFDAVQVRNTNIAAYGKERILSKGAEIDVFLAQTGAMNRTDYLTVSNETGFRLIKAVREGEIYFVDEMIVSRPTFRLLDGILFIGNLLYPDIFSRAEQFR